MTNPKFVITILFVILYHFQISVCDDNNKAVENSKIIIIGAGASGIAAASKLFENGFKNVKILEAGDRIGGRVFTTQFGNYTVDLGAQWIDGEKGNVAFDLASPLGVVDKSDDPDFGLTLKYLDSSGNLLNDDLTNKISDFYFKYVSQYESNNNVTDGESLGKRIEILFDEEFKDTPEIFNEKNKYLHQLESFSLGEYPADNWNDVAVLRSDQYKDCGGDFLISWKERGWSTILDILMKRYPNSENELPVINNTILNSEVISIDYSKVNNGSHVLVATKQQVYEADHVIVTIALGLLKTDYKSLFTPSLSNEKAETIEGFGFGTINKIYLLFDQPFWKLNERVLNFAFIWNDADRKTIENDPEKNWLLGVTGAMTVQYKPNLLEIWVVEPYVKRMELLPNDKILNHTVEVLHKFLDKTHVVSTPTAMLRSNWHTNPYSKGSYSYRRSNRKNASPEILEKPLTPEDLAILFAGEATSKDRYATVDGAISAGWNAADRLINHYKKSVKE